MMSVRQRCLELRAFADDIYGSACHLWPVRLQAFIGFILDASSKIDITAYLATIDDFVTNDIGHVRSLLALLGNAWPSIDGRICTDCHLPLDIRNAPTVDPRWYDLHCGFLFSWPRSLDSHLTRLTMHLQEGRPMLELLLHVRDEPFQNNSFPFHVRDTVACLRNAIQAIAYISDCAVNVVGIVDSMPPIVVFHEECVCYPVIRSRSPSRNDDSAFASSESDDDDPSPTPTQPVFHRRRHMVTPESDDDGSSSAGHVVLARQPRIRCHLIVAPSMTQAPTKVDVDSDDDFDVVTTAHVIASRRRRYHA